MQVVVPYFNGLRPLEARMLRLAEFLGIPCEGLDVAKASDYGAFFKSSTPDRGSCLAVSPQVMKEWVGEKGVTADLIAFLLSRFTHMLLYGLQPGAFHSEMVNALSGGRLKSVDAIQAGNDVYSIAKNSNDICEAFSGLSFGPVNRRNDHIMSLNGSGEAVRQLISIRGQPFMALTRVENTEILFVASTDVADLDEEAGDGPMAGYFSRLVPYIMALRYVAGDECWRPKQARASIIIDDPLLRKSYGFLKFESLLHFADQHKVHTTIAFIPHNFRRNSPRITQMFQENSARLSICFHGNDHTAGEFASTDLTLLNSLLRVAEERMDLHQKMTGLSCDRVMAFPQGVFSVEAMNVLKFHNFCAAVNTVPHAAGQQTLLTIGELAQPAVLRYGGFPLFIRKPIEQTKNEEIAFNVFFGRPVLVVEHHGIFRHPELLVEVAERIDSVAPGILWSDLGTVVKNAVMMRRAADGTHHVRAYTGTVQIANSSNSMERYSIEWSDAYDCDLVEQALMDRAPVPDFVAAKSGIQLTMELAPGGSRTVSLVNRNPHKAIRGLGLRWSIRAFLRRRVSELRDNYLSDNQNVMMAARAVQRFFLKYS